MSTLLRVVPNIITGYYMTCMYMIDVENDNTLRQLPAIIYKNHVFVDEQATTIVIITSLSISDKSITVSTMFITTTKISTNTLASSLILSSSISSIR